ncbi:unnamed protein product [Cuscuta campestris]|uniref:Uncharacterized protein n=1 Tax=Cuscuta campestris TaxID=132261 RepID=A0A484LJR8_9ASTE|nr:unnamed protein product [Cuscuta campestris]
MGAAGALVGMLNEGELAGIVVLAVCNLAVCVEALSFDQIDRLLQVGLGVFHTASPIKEGIGSRFLPPDLTHIKEGIGLSTSSSIHRAHLPSIQPLSSSRSDAALLRRNCLHPTRTY